MYWYTVLIYMFTVLYQEFINTNADHQTFDLPPGYESQVKLEVVESYEPMTDEKRVPDDSCE